MCVCQDIPSLVGDAGCISESQKLVLFSQSITWYHSDDQTSERLYLTSVMLFISLTEMLSGYTLCTFSCISYIWKPVFITDGQRVLSSHSPLCLSHECRRFLMTAVVLYDSLRRPLPSRVKAPLHLIHFISCFDGYTECYRTAVGHSWTQSGWRCSRSGSISRTIGSETWLLMGILWLFLWSNPWPFGNWMVPGTRRVIPVTVTVDLTPLPSYHLHTFLKNWIIKFQQQRCFYI